MVVGASLLLLSVPVLRVAAGGAAVVALSAAARVAGDRRLRSATTPRRPALFSGGRPWRGRLSRPGRPGADRRTSWPVDGAGYWFLTGLDGCDAASCERFLAATERWPRSVWTALGRAAGDAGTARQESERRLEALVAAHGLHVAAWLVRDLVATSAAMACEHATPTAGRAWPLPPTPVDGRALAAACRVVELAALARLLRPRLAHEDYLVLTRAVVVVELPNTPSSPSAS